MGSKWRWVGIWLASNDRLIRGVGRYFSLSFSTLAALTALWLALGAFLCPFAAAQQSGNPDFSKLAGTAWEATGSRGQPLVLTIKSVEAGKVALVYQYDVRPRDKWDDVVPFEGNSFTTKKSVDSQNVRLDFVITFTYAPNDDIIKMGGQFQGFPYIPLSPISNTMKRKSL